MKDAIELNIKGIKCDNPECDFRDDNVQVEDYDKWLNKSCPKCGANLLTQADYDNTKAILEIVKITNSIFPKRKDNEEIVTGKIEMDGTGKIDFTINS
ncbi:hypothetical protein HYH96_17815 [Clostridium botulinum]|uniref:Uncharacterized protein n=2 Tax=Clostridium botulinum TaxID=1491 RepID=A0A433ZGC6_CLOBO|nr:hypothetical protein [Clostridium botulinum]EKX80609.1 hypothetical protein CFSAN001628_005509 [Clostridium botulinum CFSAN001628]ACA57445.1 hypothetical protein CLK_A0257 [Clostridium botulinum A3 str. Loch Maree]ACQ51141.1 hypothetical protein CLJ_0175 [Clostridium botulinum Ba4 str. 657]AXG90448.1 hypothetical protein AGE29_01150 [Clostridium botulinum]KEI94150.1 hypothetical protein N494_18740 [Clostridium botulinum A2B7 92]